MEPATGGIVSAGESHYIGDDCCSHCPPLPDPDYRRDVEGITGTPIVIHPVKTDITSEEIEKMIRENLKMRFKIQKKKNLMFKIFMAKIV